MKNQNSFLKLLLLGILVSFTSCQKETSQNLDEEQNLIVSNTFNYSTSSLSRSNDNYIVSCSGGCPDGSACQVHHNTGNDYASCTCGGCVLNVTFRDRNGQMQVASREQSDEIQSLDWGFANFDKYILEKYEMKDVAASSLEFLFGENAYSVMYTYEIDQKEKYIMFVFELNEGRFNGSSFTIECASGTCDCRPRFVFEPPAAECSCSPCVMTVNEVKK